MGITLPERLADKLSTDDRLTAAVHGTLAEFGPWVEYSGTPLFPEYTDHGPRHIEKVLTTASSLIRDEAWGIVTPMDAALLMLATLLHDSAMHLSEDGFLALVRGEAGQRRLGGFEEEAWPSLWDAYLHRARRWDSRKMEELFGESIEVRDPPDCKGEWTRFDRMLYGEFVRRNHGRFAHEVALRGVPGPDGQHLDVSQHFEEDVRGLGGLLARSHSLPVRAIMPHLSSRYHLRSYKCAHAVFLATVLRVADYLEASPERASGATLKIARLLSPVSRAEARFNEAIVDVPCEEDDPEALFVKAAPQNVQIFLKVSEWLANVQAELDASWAVLGEVYGRHQALAPLGLTIRRVHSNLDNTAEFARQASYVPRKVRMEVARSEVLPLLIGPLYDDDPIIGVRELLQNALDAVRELRDYLDRRPGRPAPDVYEQDADVDIWVGEPGEDDALYVTVTDKGIGMTEDVICDYFLTAGGTYRASDEWKDLHERTEAEVADEGTPVSRVLRSGRFGVGVLAAFLLGEEITVTTRHVAAAPDKALTFRLRPDTDAVEITYCDAPVGTRVRVSTTTSIVNGLLCDARPVYGRLLSLYLLDDPVVVLRTGATGESRAMPSATCPPPGSAPLSLDWHSVTAPGYAEVQWSHWYEHPYLATIVCNGMPLGDGRTDTVEELGQTPLGTGATACAPLTSIFDPDAKLPTDLRRYCLRTRPPFDHALRADVLRWLFAWMLVGLPELPQPEDFLTEEPLKLAVPAPVLSDEDVALPVACRPGYSMVELLPDLLPSGLTACAVATRPRTDPGPARADDCSWPRFVRPPDVLVRSGGIRRLDFPDRLLAPFVSLGLCDPINCGLDRTGSLGLVGGLDADATEPVFGRIVFPSPLLGDEFDAWINLVGGRNLNCVRHEYPAVFESPGCPPSFLAAVDGQPPASAYKHIDGAVAVLELFAERGPVKRQQHDFVREVWMDTFGAPVIPYGLERRRDELAAAYRKLERHIKSVEHAIPQSKELRERWNRWREWRV